MNAWWAGGYQTCEKSDNVAARVFKSYRPLLAAAKICGDDVFAEQMLPILLRGTAELKEAQGSEPDGLIARAIVEAVYATGVAQWQNSKFSEITESIWKGHRVSLQPRQVGPLARELGFETKPSHGRTVVAPSPAALMRACDKCGYTDESIEDLRRMMQKPETE